MKHVNLLTILFVLTIIFAACDSGEEQDPVVSEKGFLILNEGSFNQGNASLSFLSLSDSTVSNDVFYKANDYGLGDQAQGIAGIGEQIFITVQNSGKVEIIDKKDYSSIATIDSRLISPRYTYAGEDGIFVSDWNDGFSGWLKAIDPSSFEVIDSVETGSGPNLPVVINNEIWVPNGGGFSTDSTISVFELNLSYKAELEAGINPLFIKKDRNNEIWVICKGKAWPENDTREASVVHYDQNGNLLEEIPGPEGKYFNSVAYNQDADLFYLGTSSGVYLLNPSSGEITEPFILLEGVYGLEYDPENEWVLVGVSTGFTTNGEVHIYNSDGSFVMKSTVGIGPNGFLYVEK